LVECQLKLVSDLNGIFGLIVDAGLFGNFSRGMFSILFLYGSKNCYTGGCFGISSTDKEKLFIKGGVLTPKMPLELSSFLQ